MKILIDQSKNFYKTNLHCHTVNSDGALTPEKIKEEYMKRGYSAVAFTDHEHLIDNSHLTDDRFVAITGCELAVKELSSGSTLTHPDMKATHLCLYALDPHNTVTPCYNSKYDHFVTPSVEGRIRHDGEYERRYGKDGINEIISACHDKGFLVCYNHPGWSLEDATDYLGYEDADFIEIVNTGSMVNGLYDDEAACSEMLRHGKRIYCTAADDNHNRKPLSSPRSDSFGGFVMINAQRLEYGELLSALQKGDFYASESPEIYSLVEDGGEVRIKCSPVRKISILSAGRRSKAIYPEEGRLITEAAFEVKSFGGFRLRLEDNEGKRAYTQFYLLDE